MNIIDTPRFHTLHDRQYGDHTRLGAGSLRRLALPLAAAADAGDDEGDEEEATDDRSHDHRDEGATNEGAGGGELFVGDGVI